MAKKRSKKDRLRTEAHRLTKVKLKSSSVPKKEQKPEKTSVEENYLEKIFAYDSRLIVKDLKKTFIVVIIILLVLLAIALLYT